MSRCARVPWLALWAATGCWEPTVMPAPAQHAACTSPLPERMPEEPMPTPEAAGYNLGLPTSACTAEALPPECSPDPRLACPADSRCVHLDDEAPSGLCLVHPALAEPALDGARLSYREGGCLSTVSAVDRAKLCCDDPERVDCRVFPLTSRDRASGPGELCQKHADCEPGLVCRPQDDVARCTCPGVVKLVNEHGCESVRAPSPWGLGQLDIVDDCSGASVRGYMVERIARLPCRGLSAGLAGGLLHVVCADPEAGEAQQVHWLRGTTGAFEDQTFNAPARGVSAFATDGTTLAGAVASGRTVWWIDPARGVADLIQDQNAAPPVAVAVAGGAPRFAYRRSDTGDVVLALGNDADVSEHAVLAASPDSLALFVDDAGAHILLWTEPGVGLFGVRGQTRDFVRYPLMIDGSVAPARGLSSAGLSALAFDASDPSDDTAQVRVLTRQGDRYLDDPVARTARTSAFVADVASTSVAVHAGAAHVAYRSSLGIAYGAPGKEPIALVPEAERPVLVLDDLGKAHVFYSVVTRDAAGEVTGGELRHVHEGKCPRP